MNCPVCKTTELAAVELDDALPAHLCASCEGHWISGRGYHDWLTRRGETLPERPYDGPEITVDDTQQAKICPECSRILLRYAVGRGTGFGVDQCGACNGVWLDRGEWEALKGRNLHDEVNRIFTEPWQSAARREERREAMERIYARRFGADYDEIKRVRAWLDGHSERDRLLAFLMDRDPYAS